MKKKRRPEKTDAFLIEKKQMTGIEPASPAWEAGILPMNYICVSYFIIAHF